MKILLTFVFTTTFIASFAQQKINFGYDNAGNQTSRTLCLTGCASKTSKDIKEIEYLVDEDLQKFFPNDMISYYPNPVKEELYLQWELLNERKVTSITVYGLNGQVLKSYTTTNLRSQNISFHEYSTGIYLVVLNYSDDEQKAIKIIKQ